MSVELNENCTAVIDDECDQNTSKSNGNEMEDHTGSDILAFELMDSNSNETDLDDSLLSQNFSFNVSNEDLPNKIEFGDPSSQGNTKVSTPMNAFDMDSVDSHEIQECGSLNSLMTSGIESIESDNYNLNSASLTDLSKISDVKEHMEQGDSLQAPPDSDTDSHSNDIPNGCVKTSLNENNPNLKIKLPDGKKKLNEIWEALEKGNITFLREAAASPGGLIKDEVRQKVWPKLVGVDLIETSPRPSIDDIQAHPYYQQVVLDVNRSLQRFPPSIKEAQRLTMLDQLVFLIMRVLCKHPEMHYYQGYHDICVTFLLVLGEETAYHVVEKLSRTHLNDFMERTMEPTIHLLEHMFYLIGKRNPLLKNFLLQSEVGVAYCLSWLITWFGHVLSDYDNVVRLFDLFIVSHPWMPMYLTSTIVLHREEEVLKQDCDMASVHSLLANIPDNLPFEDLISESQALFKQFPPEILSVERPYIKKAKGKPSVGWTLVQSISKKLKSAVPGHGFTLPLVIAAAVLVTAVIYQAYKY